MCICNQILVKINQWHIKRNKNQSQKTSSSNYITTSEPHSDIPHSEEPQVDITTSKTLTHLSDMSNIFQNNFESYNSSDSFSIRLLDSTIKLWMIRSIQNDTRSLIELLRYYPELVTQIDPISGFTALHWAAKHGNLNMINVLGESNLVNINHKSHGGYTALHIGQQYGHVKVVDALIDKYKANTNIRDNYGFKPHQYAKRRTYNRLLLSVLL